MNTSAMHDMNGEDFFELSFYGVPEGFSGILIAELAGIGFDGFTEEETCLFAYIRADGFDEQAVDRIQLKYPELGRLSRHVVSLPAKNWNEVWESNYEPVLIAGRCHIRAPFHPVHPTPGPSPGSPGKWSKPPLGGLGVASGIIELIIEPKMSFGTGHHETTALMIEWLLDEPVAGKRVLDMGCGTGVLAILACRLGAREVVAIDNNPWAVENAKENAERNKCAGIDVILGEVPDIPAPGFDLIVANINRNVLLEQLPGFAGRTLAGGTLLLSGFFAGELPAIRACAERNGFRPTGARTSNGWMAAKFDR